VRRQADRTARVPEILMVGFEGERRRSIISDPGFFEDGDVWKLNFKGRTTEPMVGKLIWISIIFLGIHCSDDPREGRIPLQEEHSPSEMRSDDRGQSNIRFGPNLLSKRGLLSVSLQEQVIEVYAAELQFISHGLSKSDEKKLLLRVLNNAEFQILPQGKIHRELPGFAGVGGIRELEIRDLYSVEGQWELRSGNLYIDYFAQHQLGAETRNQQTAIEIRCPMEPSDLGVMRLRNGQTRAIGCYPKWEKN